MTKRTVDLDQRDSHVVGKTFNGVVIGLLVGYGEGHVPLVAFPANPREKAIAARSTTALAPDDVGKEVALLFEGGDPQQPIIIGPIHQPQKVAEPPAETPTSVEIDGERILLSAKKEIVLKCGKASITLTKAGKVLIRGDYVLSRSSGVNRVKGGVVHIN